MSRIRPTVEANVHTAPGAKTIPRVLHFMWLSREGSSLSSGVTESPGDTTKYPEKYEKYIQSWTRYNPGYEVKFWYDADIRRLWLSDHPLARKYRDFYSRLRLIERCDLSRYLIMYIYGGVYLDLNVMCYKSVDGLLDGDTYVSPSTRGHEVSTDLPSTTRGSREIGFTFEPEENYEEYDDSRISNSLLMSIPGHDWWPCLMEYIVKNYTPAEGRAMVLENTSPIALSRYFALHPDPKKENYLLDTCQVQPYHIKGLTPTNHRTCITRDCQRRNLTKEMYCAKLWYDTAGWGLSGSPDPVKITEVKISEVKIRHPSSRSVTAWVIIALVLIILFAVLVVWLMRR